MSLKLSVAMAVAIMGAGVATPEQVPTVATTDLWYGPVLRGHFPATIPIHGWDYPLRELPCLQQDITTFDVTATGTGGAFQVRGSVALGKVATPFSVLDGAQGKRYMLHLQAYLFSPNGRLVWRQQGFPAGGAWVEADGDSASFTLIGSYSGRTSGHELIVLAAGDPIFSDSSETRVVLGAKRLVLP